MAAVFTIFPQPKFIPGFSEPIKIILNKDSTKQLSSLEDEQVYILDAIDKKPYNLRQGRPYYGLRNSPVKPNKDGNFDSFPIDSREFSCAMTYAIVRMVLDVWEKYLGKRICWHFRDQFEKLEIIPLLDWDGVHSGNGFIELGYVTTNSGQLNDKIPYCQNFDVLAHELGHLIVYSQLGMNPKPTLEEKAFLESSADMIAIISALHFDQVIENLLEDTKGNLYQPNFLTFIGNFSPKRYARSAIAISEKKSDQDFYGLSEQITRSWYKAFTQVFFQELVKRSLITNKCFEQLKNDTNEIRQHYFNNKTAFFHTVAFARDWWGMQLVKFWSEIAINLQFVKLMCTVPNQLV